MTDLEIVSLIYKVASDGLESDKAVFKLCERLVERTLELKARLEQLEQKLQKDSADTSPYDGAQEGR